MSLALIYQLLGHIEDLVSDRRLQLIVGFFTAAYLVWRQPRPRKGASNKAVLITGCDSGMGHRLARRFDEMEMHVFAGCLYPYGPGAAALKDACSKRLHVVPLDVKSEKQVEEAVAYVKGNLPCGEKGLYCLINNAGILAFTNFELMTTEMCQEVIEVNLMGAIRVTKQFLPLLKKASGRIVSITSILARLTCPNTAVYAATKHALNGFFSSLRMDLDGSGLHIALIEPGDFGTTTDIHQWTKNNVEKMWESLSADEKSHKREFYEETKKRINKEKLPEDERESNFKYIISDVEDAMLSEEPYGRYVCAPISHKIVLGIFRLLPECISQSLMSKSAR